MPFEKGYGIMSSNDQDVLYIQISNYQNLLNTPTHHIFTIKDMHVSEDHKRSSFQVVVLIPEIQNKFDAYIPQQWYCT